MLAVTGVSKRFGGVRAVEDVSISVQRGEIASIIGPNGAGKTSLLNMISGFYRPTPARSPSRARDITRARPAEIAALGIARTFQNIALFGGMTVLDNIMLGPARADEVRACCRRSSIGGWRRRKRWRTARGSRS